MIGIAEHTSRGVGTKAEVWVRICMGRSLDSDDPADADDAAIYVSTGRPERSRCR